jgi:hypothetical protein
MAKKILQVIENLNSSGKYIIKNNLNYLLSRWCCEKDFESFPYSLCNCTSEVDFYNSYVDIIFPALIREGKTNDAQKVCLKLGISFEEILKNCCSKIIPWILKEEESSEILEQDNFNEIRSCLKYVRENLQDIIIHLGKKKFLFYLNIYLLLRKDILRIIMHLLIVNLTQFNCNVNNL